MDMGKKRHSKGTPGSKGGQFAQSPQPQQLQSGTPLSLEQVEDLRTLVTPNRMGAPITDRDVVKILGRNSQDDGLRPPVQRPAQERPSLETLIALNSTYGGSEYSRMLLDMPEEDIAEELKEEDRDLANDWIENNQGLAAERHIKSGLDGLRDPTEVVTWAYEDMYYGSLIRASASLEGEVSFQRPSKEQVVALCAQNEPFQQECLDIVNGQLPQFNALGYHRLCDEIGNTEVIYSLEAEAANSDGDLPSDYVEFN